MRNRSSTRLHYVAVFFLFSAAAPLTGWSHAAENAAALLRVTEDVRYLAADAMQGRGPGTQGLEEAASYVSDRFRELGLASGALDGSYRQPFQVPLRTVPVADQTSLVLHGPEGQKLELQLGEDFQVLASGGAGNVTAPIVFVGYGISAPKLGYDDYAGVDVAGKIVLVLRKEPQQDNEDSSFKGKETTSHAYIRTKLQQAKRREAVAVLLVNDPFSTDDKGEDKLSSADQFGKNPIGVPFAHVSQATVNQILADSALTGPSGETLDSLQGIETAIDRDFTPVSQALAGWSAELSCAFEQKTVEVANVVGVLEGRGPSADETVVLGAHYDHIGFGEFGSRRPGVREVHNGADDNASGTAAVLEMARRFAQRPTPPSRRLVFIAFTAEEKGLLGSKHYLDEPLFPLDDTVAMLNYDMVGRLRSSELTIFGTNSAVGLSDLLDSANGGELLKLKKINRVIRSGDHFDFYQKGIPVLHFFTGFTDDYHTPDDDFETLNMPGMLQTIDYTERLLDEILALPERLAHVPPGDQRKSRGGIPYLGIIPDYSEDAEGLQVSEVTADTPAAKAGLETGDVIVQLGESAVSDVESLRTALRRYRPGDMVNVVVRRGGQEISCNVTLGRPQG